MKKKVLFCVPPSCGGAERVTLTIAKLLDSDKYDVKVVIIGKTTGDIKNFVPDYMGIIHVKIRNIWDFTTLRLVNLFKKERPDIVFCSLLFLNARIILAAKIARNMKIIIRNSNSLNLLRYDGKLLAKLLYPKADSIILQTDEMKKELQNFMKVDINKLHVIFNPIDVDSINFHLKMSECPFDSQYINYVFVGRINYMKGLDILLLAFAHVVKRNKKSRLYIVGKIKDSDSYFQSLNKLIIDLRLDEHVIWTDFTNNPYQYIKYANCFVLPSRIEGLPNVLLDAMYLQVPVVVTRSVPVIDRIVTKERGKVVDVNDKDALAKAMMEMKDLKVTTPYASNDYKVFLQLFKS